MIGAGICPAVESEHVGVRPISMIGGTPCGRGLKVFVEGIREDTSVVFRQHLLAQTGLLAQTCFLAQSCLFFFATEHQNILDGFDFAQT